MYSVVETTEKRKTVVIAVPSKWVINGCILMWPNIKNKVELDQLLKDPEVLPDMGVWKSQKCSVRATGLKDYETALTVEDAFSKCIDTEDEELILNKITKAASHGDCTPNNLNSALLEISLLDEQPAKKIRTERSNNNDVVIEQEIIGDAENVNNNNASLLMVQPPINIEELTENIISGVKEQIESIVNSVLSAKFISIETKLDEILKKCKPQHVSVETVDDMGWCTFQFPLRTQEEIQKLEKALLVTSFHKKMVDHLRYKTCAYDTKDTVKVTKRLLKYLFTLEALRTFTWKGKGKKNPAFAELSRILSLMLEVERSSDSSYNEEKSHNFLQNRFFKCLNQTIRRSSLNKSTQDHNGQEEIEDVDDTEKNSDDENL